MANPPERLMSAGAHRQAFANQSSVPARSHGTSGCWLVVALSLLATGALADPPVPAGERTEGLPTKDGLKATYHHNFVTDGFDRAQFRFAPFAETSARNWIHADSRGLRIAIPSGVKAPAGVLPAFLLHGDFELTATYETGPTEAPQARLGAGPELYLRTQGPESDRKFLAVSRNVTERATFFFAVESTPGTPQRRYRPKTLPATAETGTLRLKRTGRTVEFFARDGDAGKFQLISSLTESVADDLSVRIGATTGNTPSAVTVTWKEVAIAADALPQSKPPADDLPALASFAVAADSVFARPAFKTEYRYDFRNAQFDDLNFGIADDPSLTQVTQDLRGLRITVPAGARDNLGIRSKFGVRGDFDVSATFAILAAEHPTEGYGVGAEFYLRSVDGWGHFVDMGRFLRKEYRSPILVPGHGVKVDGKSNFRAVRIATDLTSGKLRMIRRGPTVTYFVAEEASNAFRQVFQTNYGTTDFDMIRLTAVVGGSRAAVDVLWKDVTILADELPGLNPTAR
jgi:hypothetical protein